MKILRTYLYPIGLIIVLLGTYIYFQNAHQAYNSISSFEDCVARGYPVSTTYPEVCSMPGKKFIHPNQNQLVAASNTMQTVTGSAKSPFGGVSFVLEGEKVTLQDTHNDPQSYASTSLVFHGPRADSDLNNDGTQDAAFITVADTDGSGTFYYLVVAFKQKDGYIGSNGIFLGDRIEPISIHIDSKRIILVTYKDRDITDPMTEKPHVEVTKQFVVNNLILRNK